MKKSPSDSALQLKLKKVNQWTGESYISVKRLQTILLITERNQESLSFKGRIMFCKDKYK